jgi:hypothetical protein
VHRLGEGGRLGPFKNKVDLPAMYFRPASPRFLREICPGPPPPTGPRRVSGGGGGGLARCAWDLFAAVLGVFCLVLFWGSNSINLGF